MAFQCSEEHSSALTGTHRRQRTSKMRRRSTDEAPRFVALISASAAFVAGLRSIVASFTLISASAAFIASIVAS
jgi:hypothetical protein